MTKMVIRKAFAQTGKITTALCLALSLTVTACDSSNSNPLEVLSVSDSITNSPLDVMAVVSTTRSVPEISASMENLLLNGDFENGKSDWSECADRTLGQIETDAYSGSSALKVFGGSCFYQSVEVSPGSDLNLSCYVKVQDDIQWTGMGLGFSDSNWATINTTPATVITGSNYARYDVRASAPANTRYVSMWFFSETKALVDSCVLNHAENATLPSESIGANLLLNASFDKLLNEMPIEWARYCGGTASVFSGSGENFLVLGGGACVAQSLRSSALAAMQGKPVKLACDIDYQSAEYAEIILNLDGVDRITTVAPNSSGTIEYLFTAPSKITNGFISIYSEGATESMQVRECSLKVVNPDPTPTASIDVRNMIEGSDTWFFGFLSDVTISVINTGNTDLTNVNVVNDSIDQCSFSYPSLVPGETKTEFCTSPTQPSLMSATDSPTITHNVTATATTNDGSTVTDSDPSTLKRSFRNSPRQQIAVSASTYSVNTGDDVIFTIDVGNNGNTSTSDVRSIVSNVEACNREFTPAIGKGQFQSYTCVAENIQNAFTAEFSTGRAVTNSLGSASTSVEITRTDDEEAVTYNVGDPGPAGGFVFQVSADGLSGLEIMPNDITSGAGVAFGCEGTDVAGAIELIGASTDSSQTGSEKTALLNQAGCDAAVLATNYTSTVSQTPFEDWFLPTALELRSAIIALNSAGMPLPDTTNYWSSTELVTGTTSESAVIYFADSSTGSDPKTEKWGVAPVRVF